MTGTEEALPLPPAAVRAPPIIRRAAPLPLPPPAPPLPAPATQRGALEMLELRVGGEIHTEWTGATVTRGIDRLASAFVLHAGLLPGATPFERFPPFAPVEVRLGGELVMTGWIEAPGAEISGASEETSISGRSKTCDLVDCTPELRGTEFRGSTLDAIARAVCEPFGIEVVVAADMGPVIDLTAMDKTKTGFAFLNDLARMRGVLLTDDEQGRLVLSRTGSEAQAGVLEMPGTLSRLGVRQDVSKRFSRYVVLSQVGSASSAMPSPDPEAMAAEPPGGGVQPAVNAVALDARVPRYRPHILQAEEAATAAEAQTRADWQRSHAVGRSLTVTLTVPGTWRDEAGALFRTNRRQQVRAERYGLDDELLIVSVAYGLDRNGRHTTRTLGPPEGYTPEPVRRTGGKGGAARLDSPDPAAVRAG